MPPRLTWLLALTLLPLSACDAAATIDAGQRDAAGAMPTVELGTGTASFVTVPDSGGELELVGGPQGGFHVFVTARLSELDVEGMSISYSAVDTATGDSVGTPATFVTTESRLARDGDGWVRAGDFLILHDSAPEPVRGLTLEITVRVEEAGGGRSAEDRRTVRIVDNEMG